MVKCVWAETSFRHVCQCRHPRGTFQSAFDWQMHPELDEARDWEASTREEPDRCGFMCEMNWPGWTDMTASDSNHNLTSFSPVSLSPVRHAWPPRVTRVFTSLHSHLLTVNMTCIRSGTLWIVTSVSSVRSWYDRIRTVRLGQTIQRLLPLFNPHWLAPDGSAFHSS